MAGDRGKQMRLVLVLLVVVVAVVVVVVIVVVVVVVVVVGNLGGTTRTLGPSEAEGSGAPLRLTSKSHKKVNILLCKKR